MQNISTGENVSIKIRQYFSNVYFGPRGFPPAAGKREGAPLTSPLPPKKKKKKKAQFILIFF